MGRIERWFIDRYGNEYVENVALKSIAFALGLRTLTMSSNHSSWRYRVESGFVTDCSMNVEKAIVRIVPCRETQAHPEGIV